MQLKTFEVGIQRLYYVTWILLFLVTNAVNVLKVMEDIESGHLYPHTINWLFGGAISTLIGPLIAMWMIRWVYRGFFPAPPPIADQMVNFEHLNGMPNDVRKA